MTRFVVLICLCLVGCNTDDKTSTVLLEIADCRWSRTMHGAVTTIKDNNKRELTFAGMHDFCIGKSYHIVVETASGRLISFDKANTTDVVINLTEDHSELPDGYGLQRSEDGRWRYVRADGYDSFYDFPTKTEAVAFAWKMHDYKKDKDKRGKWTSVSK